MINPIDILHYGTISARYEFFLVGAALTHTLDDKKNSVNFQFLNSRTRSIEEQYGSSLPVGVTASETPFVGVANWKGHLFDNKLETSYSYCYFIDAENMGRNLISLGNKLKLGKFLMYYDFEFSQEDLDQRLIVSNIIKSKQSFAAQDVDYMRNWIRAEYKVKPKVNLLLSLMATNSYWNGNPDPNSSTKLQTSYSVVPSIEYAPFSDLNMKFFVGYIGTKFDYSSYAKSQFGVSDYNISQFSIGIIAPLLVL